MAGMTSDTPGDHGEQGATDALRVRRRPRWVGWLAWLAGLAAFGVAAVYVATSPEELPTSDEVVTATTPADRPVYLGVFQADASFGRSLTVSGVKVFAESTVPVTITPHLCRGGSLGVTSEPEPFCAELVPTEGATLTAGDEVVLEVRGAQPGTVRIERVRIAYRDRLQWATQFAGSPAVVSILSR